MDPATAMHISGPSPITSQHSACIALRHAACGVAILMGASHAQAQTTPEAVMKAFADHCFSPFLTAAKAQAAFAGTGARVDFYDLDPFSDVAPSPARNRAPTPGSNRRCEVAFAGDHTASAVDAVMAALHREGIDETADVPPAYQSTPETALLAARYLNPTRIAVVEVGTRRSPDGPETFMRVERLPEEGTQ